MCAPVQLGVSATRAICRGTVPQPGDLLPPPQHPCCPLGAPLQRREAQTQPQYPVRDPHG